MVRNSANLSILHLHVAATRMGYVVSTQQVQYVNVCSNGVQFTRGSMHLTSILINDSFVKCDLYKCLIIIFT